MDLQKIKDIAKHLMAERKAHLFREKGSIFYHGQSTANLIIELRKKILPNDSSHDNILTVAAWFHDCGKGMEPHQNYGAVITREALKDYISVKELNMICSMIKGHCIRLPEDNNYDDYTKLLQDADLIDHFGVNGIWICLKFCTQEDENINDFSKFYNDNQDSYTSKNRNLLNFKFSKEIFDERVTFENEFIARLNDEGIGNIHKK